MARKILVVSGDRSVVRLAQLNLERQGYTVVTAASGANGLARLATEYPDLVIVHDTLPDMVDGYDFACEVRRQPEYRDVRIIRITHPPAESARFRSSCEADAYVRSPVNWKVLLGFVRRLLDDRSGPGPTAFAV